MSSDCGFGRQGCNREIAFYKASAIAQGCNIVRKELGLEATYVPAADPALQMDIVPKTRFAVRLSGRRREGYPFPPASSALPRRTPSAQRRIDDALRFADDLSRCARLLKLSA